MMFQQEKTLYILMKEIHNNKTEICTRVGKMISNETLIFIAKMFYNPKNEE